MSMRSCLAIVPGLLVATTALGWAQTPPRTPQEGQQGQSTEPGEKDTVTSRKRPEYDPLGVRLGDFFLYPEASLTEAYRDNVYYRSSGKDSDFISVFSPNVQLKSNWNVHALNLFAGMDVGRYLDNTGEDYLDWHTGFDGRVDIDRSANMTGGFTYAHKHESRSSPDQTSAAEPVEYDQYGPNAKITKRFNRLSLQLGGDLTVLDFSNARAGNGTLLNEDARDRLETHESFRAGYEIVPDYEAFIRTTINQRNYDESSDSNGLDRDSHGWETVGGLAIDLGGVTSANVFAGYLRQDFDDPTLETIDGPGFGGDVTWNPTRLTTVKAAVQRTVEETTLSGAAGALSTQVRLGVDHELLRNVILSADTEYQNNDYQGISRQDDIYVVGAGGDYLLNRHLRLRLRYTYDRRDSNATDGDYRTNTVFLRLVTQY